MLTRQGLGAKGHWRRPIWRAPWILGYSCPQSLKARESPDTWHLPACLPSQDQIPSMTEMAFKSGLDPFTELVRGGWAGHKGPTKPQWQSARHRGGAAASVGFSKALVGNTTFDGLEDAKAEGGRTEIRGGRRGLHCTHHRGKKATPPFLDHPPQGRGSRVGWGALVAVRASWGTKAVPRSHPQHPRWLSYLVHLPIGPVANHLHQFKNASRILQRRESKWVKVPVSPEARHPHPATRRPQYALLGLHGEGPTRDRA